MPPARGEGMTGSPIRLPCAGKPALKTTTTHRPNKPESSTSLVDLPALNSIRRTASRPARTRKLAERTKTTQPLVLTGPSPSGMTCVNPGRADRILTCDHLTPSVIFGIRAHPCVSRLRSSSGIAGGLRTSTNTHETGLVAIQVAIHCCPLKHRMEQRNTLPGNAVRAATRPLLLNHVSHIAPTAGVSWLPGAAEVRSQRPPMRRILSGRRHWNEV